MKIENKKILHTDILIIGGGTAGCYAALTIREKSDYSIIIAEKANIKRSGCLAAGVNAINAYIVKGRKPEDYVDYAKKDADGIVREDLLMTMSEGLNRVTDKMEKLGLVILKDENGEYVARGNRNIKINGENMKPLLAEAVSKLTDCTVINRINITDYIVENNTIKGAYGFSIEDATAYEIRAKKVLCATGGAAGLYRPNNPGFSRHKMWYPPFNTGAGYAMGIRSGAEMTTFEMRFIALRCKDTIAPTGTIAQGVGAKQVNSLGEVYETKYGLTTLIGKMGCDCFYLILSSNECLIAGGKLIAKNHFRKVGRIERTCAMVIQNRISYHRAEKGCIIRLLNQCISHFLPDGFYTVCNQFLHLDSSLCFVQQVRNNLISEIILHRIPFILIFISL